MIGSSNKPYRSPSVPKDPVCTKKKHSLLDILKQLSPCTSPTQSVRQRTSSNLRTSTQVHQTKLYSQEDIKNIFIRQINQQTIKTLLTQLKNNPSKLTDTLEPKEFIQQVFTELDIPEQIKPINDYETISLTKYEITVKKKLDTIKEVIEKKEGNLKKTIIDAIYTALAHPIIIKESDCLATLIILMIDELNVNQNQSFTQHHPSLLEMSIEGEHLEKLLKLLPNNNTGSPESDFNSRIKYTEFHFLLSIYKKLTHPSIISNTKSARTLYTFLFSEMSHNIRFIIDSQTKKLQLKEGMITLKPSQDTKNNTIIKVTRLLEGLCPAFHILLNIKADEIKNILEEKSTYIQSIIKMQTKINLFHNLGKSILNILYNTLRKNENIPISSSTYKQIITDFKKIIDNIKPDTEIFISYDFTFIDKPCSENTKTLIKKWINTEENFNLSAAEFAKLLFIEMGISYTNMTSNCLNLTQYYSNLEDKIQAARSEKSERARLISLYTAIAHPTLLNQPDGYAAFLALLISQLEPKNMNFPEGLQQSEELTILSQSTTLSSPNMIDYSKLEITNPFDDTDTHQNITPINNVTCLLKAQPEGKFLLNILNLEFIRDNDEEKEYFNNIFKRIDWLKNRKNPNTHKRTLASLIYTILSHPKIIQHYKSKQALDTLLLSELSNHFSSISSIAFNKIFEKIITLNQEDLQNTTKVSNIIQQISPAYSRLYINSQCKHTAEVDKKTNAYENNFEIFESIGQCLLSELYQQSDATKKAYNKTIASFNLFTQALKRKEHNLREKPTPTKPFNYTPT